VRPGPGPVRAAGVSCDSAVPPSRLRHAREAELEVDETDIPLVEIGQYATVTIDAMGDKVF
jgi:hypothetical protein